MLLELLQKGYGKAMNLNCAEKILYGANWAYNMQLPPQALKIAAGFGGGMGAGAACGVVTGACSRRRRLKLRQALAAVWAQVLPAAWLPVRAWCLAHCM